MTARLLTPREVVYESALRGLHGARAVADWAADRAGMLWIADVRIGLAPASARQWTTLRALGFPLVEDVARFAHARLRSSRARARAALPRDALLRAGPRGAVVYQGGAFHLVAERGELDA
jgi:hypothetical protein